MADSSRIEDLRRRVQKDPASIAFAQLAEECRRAGNLDEAVEVCRAGLQMHPGYLSARVTLGRTLIEMNDLDSAIGELEHVLRSAPENLAAIRGLAEIHHRQGNLVQALQQYRAALALARNDPDLQQTVDELTHQLEPPPAPEAEEPASLQADEDEFLKSLSAPIADDAADAEAAPAPAAAAATSYYGTPIPEAAPPAAVEVPAQVHEPVAVSSYWDTLSAPAASAAPVAVAVEPVEEAPATEVVVEYVEPPVDDLVEQAQADSVEQAQALQLLAVLEQWLDAIHVSRAQPHA